MDERGIPVAVTCALQGYRGGHPFHGRRAVHGFFCVHACADFYGIVQLFCKQQPLQHQRLNNKWWMDQL